MACYLQASVSVSIDLVSLDSYLPHVQIIVMLLVACLALVGSGWKGWREGKLQAGALEKPERLFLVLGVCWLLQALYSLLLTCVGEQ